MPSIVLRDPATKESRIDFWFVSGLSLLLVIVAFEFRLHRINLGPVSFYGTTARLALGILCLVFLGWFLRKGVRQVLREYPNVFYASLGWLLTWILSSAFSRHPGVAFERLAFYTSFLFLFWLGLALLHQRWWRHVPAMIFGLAILEACLGLAEYFIWDVRYFLARTFVISGPGMGIFFGPHEGGRLHSCGSFQNPIVFGMVMVISLIYGWIGQAAIPWALFIPGGAALVAATVVSGSRMVSMSMLAALIIKTSADVFNRRRVSLIAGAAGVIILVVMFIYQAPPKLGGIFSQLRAVSGRAQLNEYFSDRPAIWRSAWTIWKDHPVTGVGLGVYDRHLADYQEFKHLGKGGFQHPHNFILRLLCETGLVGFAAFVIFAVALSRRILRSGWLPSCWPIAMLAFFELFEEFMRDAFPCLLLVLMALYALWEAERTSGIAASGDPEPLEDY
ncbi:MAG: O-antigen ligase family protein [Elusimicrobia bacterium]|nr:O-antigen ligase family protein [Elusimicrobiota bacterium]